MKAAPFEYDAPSTPEEAVAVLASHGDESKILAGGQSLIPMLALRLAFFDRLVDIGRIPALRGIERRDDSVWIGAATTDTDVERGADVPLLVRATPFIGHLHIRNRGTIGGSLAHADPAAEYPAVALALDATFDVLSPAGRRTVAAADFFQGVWTTALAEDELLVGASFPRWTGRCGFAVDEFARRHGDFAVAGAAVAVELRTSDDAVARCAIGLIGMASTPVRATSAEAAAVGGASPEEVGRLAAAEPVDVPTDLHGTAAYRRKVCAAVVARAYGAAMDEARGG